MSGLRIAMLSVFLLAAVAALAIDPMAGKIVTINERPMISLRDFAEIFDATVDYNVERDEICISLYETTVYLVPYRMNAWVDERKVWLDMPVVIMDDITYLPVRFLCDAFRLNYDFGPDNRQVIIINRWTTERIILVIDYDWCRLQHAWRYNYDFNWYVNFHYPHREGRPYDGYHPPHDHHPPDDIDQYHNVKPPQQGGGGYHNIDPPQHGGGGNNQHHNIDRPQGGGNPYNNIDRPQSGPPQQGGGNPYQNIDRPQSGPPQQGGGNPYQNIDRPQSGPPQQGGGNPYNNIDRPQSGPPQYGGGGHNPQYSPGHGRREGDFQRDYGKPVDGAPNGGYNRPGAPLWKRDQRLEDGVRPAGSPLNLDLFRKEVVIRPDGGSPHAGPGYQSGGPPPNQGKDQQAKPQGNGGQEKESKDKSSEKDNGEKEKGGNNGHGKGRDK